MGLKAVIAVASLLLLSGCYADQQQSLGKCMLQANDKFPKSNWELGSDKEQYTRICMESEGYRAAWIQSGCNKSYKDATLIAECYLPFGTVATWLTKLQIATGL